MSIGERIAERLEALGGRPAGFSQAWLAREVGITQPAINALIKNPSAGSQHLHRIARALGTTPAYLVGETEDATLGALPAPSDDLVAEQLDAVLLREVEVSFSMGGGSVLDEWPVVQMVPFSRGWLRSLTSASAADLIVTRGDGDSMFPTIQSGEIVIINCADTTPRQQDGIWAMNYGGLGMIKRLRMLPDGSAEIRSDNKEVAPIIALEGEMSIVGKVVAIIRRIG